MPHKTNDNNNHNNFRDWSALHTLGDVYNAFDVWTCVKSPVSTPLTFHRTFTNAVKAQRNALSQIQSGVLLRKDEEKKSIENKSWIKIFVLFKMPLRESDSDESIDQLEQFRNANVKPGMFVSGWEDPNDEVFEEKNPRGEEYGFL